MWLEITTDTKLSVLQLTVCELYDMINTHAVYTLVNIHNDIHGNAVWRSSSRRYPSNFKALVSATGVPARRLTLCSYVTPHTIHQPI